MCCDLNCVCIDQLGSTALMMAAHQGHHECLSILLAHGAEVNKAAAVSVRGIASTWNVACIGFAAEWMRCILSVSVLSIKGWHYSSHGSCPRRTP